MLNSGYFISVGAGKNQMPLILKLKELGLKVIAIDQNQNAPGFAFSDIKINQSVSEYRKIYSSILRLFLDEPIIGVGSRSYGKAVFTASYLSQKFNLIGSKPEVIRNFYNKKTMKAFLGKNGILVPQSYSWQNIRDLPKIVSQIPLPCILKPVNTIAKLGIEVFKKSGDLLERITQLKTKSSQYLLEEFIEGSEVTVLGFVQNKKFILISISDKITTPYPPFLELSHRLPTLQTKQIGEIKLICQNIARLTNLENSPMVAEFKVNSKDEIFLIEVMPEVGGEYLADFLIPEFYSYDYFKNLVCLLTGNPVSPVNKKNGKNAKLSEICFIAPPEGRSKLISYKKIQLEKDRKVFLDIPLKEKGEPLNTSDGNSCRVQVFGVTTSNKDSLDALDFDIRNMYNAKFL